MTQTLPTDSAARKHVPLASGCLDYFPAALAEVARLSQAGNDKHNPGEPLHHARGKSSDHADCIMRHLADRGIVDDDGFLHEVKVAWRALALLQESLEARGAPLARGARLPAAPLESAVIFTDGTAVFGRQADVLIDAEQSIERPWIESPHHEPLLAGDTKIEVQFRDGTRHNTTVAGVGWAPCFGDASVVKYRLRD